MTAVSNSFQTSINMSGWRWAFLCAITYIQYVVVLFQELLQMYACSTVAEQSHP